MHLIARTAGRRDAPSVVTIGHPVTPAHLGATPPKSAHRRQPARTARLLSSVSSCLLGPILPRKGWLPMRASLPPPMTLAANHPGFFPNRGVSGNWNLAHLGRIRPEPRDSQTPLSGVRYFTGVASPCPPSFLRALVPFAVPTLSPFHFPPAIVESLPCPPFPTAPAESHP